MAPLRTRLPSRLALLFLAFGLVLVACAGTDTPTKPTTTTTAPPPPPPPLTPARSIAGTWTTPSAVTFIYQTDSCGQRQDVGRALWNVTWNVTAVSGYTNVVEIEMRVSRGSTTLIGNCGLTGWVPPVPPTFFQLCLSSSEITRCTGDSYKNGSAHGSFTTDLMMLTWSHWECVIVCYGEYTASNELKLTKRT